MIESLRVSVYAYELLVTCLVLFISEECTQSESSRADGERESPGQSLQGASYFDEYIPNDKPVPRGAPYAYPHGLKAFYHRKVTPCLQKIPQKLAYVQFLLYLCSEIVNNAINQLKIYHGHVTRIMFTTPHGGF